MPLIQIHLAEGRTEKQKKDLMTGMTDLTEKVIGAPRDSIRVWINEFSDTDYMASGELLKDKRARLIKEKS
jgi:4-oxalocrotonate tautomerase